MKTLLFITASILLTGNLFAQKGYQVNDAASDFELKNVDGQMVSLAGLKDAKGAIVIFTCNHCPFSVAYEDRIIELNKMFSYQGFHVVAINSNDAEAYPEDSYENMQIRARQKGFQFVYLYDETQAIARKYGAMRTPHVFVLRKVGDKFVVAYIGAIDDNTNEPDLVKQKYVENAVNAILKGEEVKPNFTKAVGCSVKYKK